MVGTGGGLRQVEGIKEGLAFVGGCHKRVIAEKGKPAPRTAALGR